MRLRAIIALCVLLMIFAALSLMVVLANLGVLPASEAADSRVFLAPETADARKTHFSLLQSTGPGFTIQIETQEGKPWDTYRRRMKRWRS